MKRLRSIPARLFAALLLAVLSERSPVAATVNFDRDIRPILSDNCFACHGPDERARKAGLRLDVRADALQPLKSGQAAVVPGDPERSSLIARVVTTDPDDLMPPPKTGKQITPDQVARLKTWIADGADWPEHWSFIPPRSSPPPALRDESGVRNDVDRFVRQRLEQEALAPSPEADRTTLARRASLDLTGLPPTIEEVDAFLADASPGAYDKLVDRLLASPRYGEHQARYWLDAVRYADSHGYHIDAQRDIWAYRQWVVNAFNHNQPFDQFTIEQLAGDLLPEATTDQKVATGFIRSNMSTGEGGVIEAEYASKYAFDRVETTGTTWLGLTLICARCHTHKYDPIPQREYYGLYGFFNQLDEPVMDGNRPNPDPFLKLPTPEQTARLVWLKAQSTQARTRLDAPAELDAGQTSWAREWHGRLAPGWLVLTPASVTSLATNGASLQVLDGGAVLAAGANPETDTYELLLRPPPGRFGGLRLEALPHESLPQRGAARAADGRFQLSEFEAEVLAADTNTGPRRLTFATSLADSVEGDHQPARATDGKADTGWIGAGEPATPRQAIFLLSQPDTLPEGASLRVRLKFETGKESRAIGHFRLSVARGDELLDRLEPPRLEPWRVLGPLPSDGLAAGLAHPYEPESGVDLARRLPGVREEVGWQERGDLPDGGTHLLVNELHGVHGAWYLFRKVHARSATALDLTLRADDVFKVWLNDRLVHESATPLPYPGVRARFRVALEPGENRLLVKMVNHQGAKHFSFEAALAGAEALAPDVATMLSVAAEPAGPWAARVREWYRRQHSPEFQAMLDNLASWREEESAIDAAVPTTLIARERAQPRETRLLARGEYDQPGDAVPMQVPGALPPLPPGSPTNRLGLARWLVRQEHPLTARVIVNRFWQQHFGHGLVKTTEDFGAQGERPSHPELLDWLATRFIQSGWDVKQLHRLMMTSATYRQSARVSPELIARDPENRLLARGPRFRLDAEVLRDAALFVGGLLVEQTGGPSVRPYEPPGLWEAVSFNNSQKYVPDRGPNQYRRSLYTYWKRQSPPPGMLLFDAPTRETCTVRRPRTNTPLQALAMLNDPQYVEAARALAQRMVREGGPTADDRLAHGFRLATARPPTRDELQVLRELLEAQLAAYRAAPAEAARLLGVGDFTPQPGADPAELAAWSTVASLILNLDETLTKG